MIKQFSARFRDEEGFSTVELSMVVAVLAVLAMIAIPAFPEVMRGITQQQLRMDVAAAALRAEQHKPLGGAYPTPADERVWNEVRADIDPATSLDLIPVPGGYCIHANSSAVPGYWVSVRFSGSNPRTNLAVVEARCS